MNIKQEIAAMQAKMDKLLAANDDTAYIYRDQIAELQRFEGLFTYLEQERDFAFEAAGDNTRLDMDLAAECWWGRYTAFKEVAEEIWNMIQAGRI